MGTLEEEVACKEAGTRRLISSHLPMSLKRPPSSSFETTKKNITRHMTDKERAAKVEILECADHDRTHERRAMEDQDEGFVILSGEAYPTTSVAAEPLSTVLPRNEGEVTMMITVSPVLSVMTAAML